MKHIEVFYGAPYTPAGFPTSKVNEFLAKKAGYSPKIHVVGANENLVVVVEYEDDSDVQRSRTLEQNATFIKYDNNIVKVEDILRLWQDGDTIFAKFKSGADQYGDDEVEISTHDSIEAAGQEFNRLCKMIGVKD